MKIGLPELARASIFSSGLALTNFDSGKVF
jgi:hypothetical protein